MFIAAQGYEWASHQTWFGAPQLSLPWLILGGIGLAIASNRSELKSLTSTTAPSQGPLSSAPTPAVPVPTPEPVPMPVPERVVTPDPLPSDPKGESISFEINAQRRPRT